VILSRHDAAEALNWTRSVMTRIGLTLNETKTSIKPACQEQFDFLGYTFGPWRYRKTGSLYLGTSPSKKSVFRLRQKVGGLLMAQKRGALARGARSTECNFARLVELLLLRVSLSAVSCRRRRKVQSRGTASFSYATVFGELGVLRLRDVAMRVRSVG
jgi:RNA-directed DNA polymerase